MSKNINWNVVDEVTGMKFVAIQGGDLMMGGPVGEKGREATEGPQHNVHVSDFHMACFEVTQEQYLEIMGENPSDVIGENCPVDGVTWEDTQEFIKKLNSINDTSYRLPTVAEWEYACRANTKTRFSFGDDITIEQVNFGSNISWQNSPVGIHPPNGFGLYDMHGNVFEWCEDTWHEL